MASLSPYFVQFMDYLTKGLIQRPLSKANSPYACPPLSLNLFTFGRPFSHLPTLKHLHFRELISYEGVPKSSQTGPID